MYRYALIAFRIFRFGQFLSTILCYFFFFHFQDGVASRLYTCMHVCGHCGDISVSFVPNANFIAVIFFLLFRASSGENGGKKNRNRSNVINNSMIFSSRPLACCICLAPDFQIAQQTSIARIRKNTNRRYTFFITTGTVAFFFFIL